MVPHIPALSGKKTGAARPAGAPSDSARGLRTTGPPKPPVASPGEPAVSDPGLPQEARRTGPARGRARCLGITRPFRKELRGARGAAVRWGWGALRTREHPRPPAPDPCSEQRAGHAGGAGGRPPSPSRGPLSRGPREMRVQAPDRDGELCGPCGRGAGCRDAVAYPGRQRARRLLRA